MNEKAIEDMYDGFQRVADTGGYVERRNALEAIAELQWFDNFGKPYYDRRLSITEQLAKSLKPEDWPDTVKEELEHTTATQ